MTPQTSPTESVLVPGAHRHIRQLDSHESPYGGALVWLGESPVVLRPAEELAGWEGWRFAGADHVAGPVDIARRSDGHDVLLPWCTERVLTFLARRSAAGEALSRGEVGTLVGSLLRGIDEIGELDGGAPSTGEWWLTEQGRPVFVIGAGGSARRRARDLIERMLSGGGDRTMTRVLTAVCEGLAQERVPRRLAQRWEDDLFEVASPQPLRTDVFASERARDVVPWHEHVGEARRHDRPAGARDALAGRLERLAELVERARMWRVDRRRARLAAATPADDGDAGGQRSSRSKRRVVVAAVAAAVVLGGGLLWPTGEADGESGRADVASADRGGEDAAEAGEAPAGDASKNTAPEDAPSAPGAPPDAAADGAESTSEGEAASEGPVGADDAHRRTVDAEAASQEAADRLVAALIDCRAHGDAECAGAVEGGGIGIPTKLACADVDDVTLSLVDEYGDIAVFRASPRDDVAEAKKAEAGELREQMLVFVRTDENWLVRDIYDVAHQPA